MELVLYNVDTLYGSKNLHRRDMSVLTEDHLVDMWERMTFGGVVVDWYPEGLANVIVRNGRAYVTR